MGRIESHIATRWEDMLDLAANPEDEHHAGRVKEDRILVVFRSLHGSNRSYVALGTKRLYWYTPVEDADEAMLAATPQDTPAGRMRWNAALRAGAAASFVTAAPEENERGDIVPAQGIFGYLPYALPSSAEGGGGDGGASGGAGGAPIRSLADCTFTLNRQGWLVGAPIGGSFLDVLRLPLRFRADRRTAAAQYDVVSGAVETADARGSVEGARLCYILNSLHAILHRSAAAGGAPAFAGAATAAASPSSVGLGWEARHVSWDALSHVAVSAETYGAHVREARQRAHDQMLLGPTGDLLPLTTPLDVADLTSTLDDLKGHLGAGVGSYLKTLLVACGALGIAALLAIPAVLHNMQGGVLSSLGYVSLGATTSLGNVPPYSVPFWPLQALDVATAAVLLAAFTWIRHAARRMAQQVGTGPLDPSPFAVYISGTNLGLKRHQADGGAADAASAPLDVSGTVEAYVRFVSGACRRETGRGGVPPPADDAVSEVLLIQRASDWFAARQQLAAAEEEEDLAVLREANASSEAAASSGGADGGDGGDRAKPKAKPGWRSRLVDARTKLIGWAARRTGAPSDSLHGASAEPASHWQAVVQRQRNVLEGMRAEGGGAEVVGAFVVFNSSDAAQKVLHELGAASHVFDFARGAPDAQDAAADPSAAASAFAVAARGVRGKGRGGKRAGDDVERALIDGGDAGDDDDDDDDDDDGLSPAERAERDAELKRLRRQQVRQRLRGHFVSATNQFRAANWMAGMSASSRMIKNAAEYAECTSRTRSSMSSAAGSSPRWRRRSTT